eukprot:9062307-Pyramimonas_sp.AAC.1
MCVLVAPDSSGARSPQSAASQMGPRRGTAPRGPDRTGTGARRSPGPRAPPVGGISILFTAQFWRGGGGA